MTARSAGAPHEWHTFDQTNPDACRCGYIRPARSTGSEGAEAPDPNPHGEAPCAWGAPCHCATNSEGVNWPKSWTADGIAWVKRQIIGEYVRAAPPSAPDPAPQGVTPIRRLESALKDRASTDGEVVSLMNLLGDALHEARHQVCACRTAAPDPEEPKIAEGVRMARAVVASHAALRYLDAQVRAAGRFMLREPSPTLDAGDQDPPERAVLLIRKALAGTGECDCIAAERRWRDGICLQCAGAAPDPGGLSLDTLARAYHVYRIQYPGGSVFCGSVDSDDTPHEFDSGPCSCRMDMAGVLSLTNFILPMSHNAAPDPEPLRRAATTLLNECYEVIPPPSWEHPGDWDERAMEPSLEACRAVARALTEPGAAPDPEGLPSVDVERWMLDAAEQLERLARIIEGRDHEARLVAPHGQTSNRPRQLLDQWANLSAVELSDKGDTR